MKLNLHKTAGPFGDSTSTYDVKPSCKCTVGDFINEVLSGSPNEWGEISITKNGPVCEYRYGSLISTLPEAFLDREVQSASANGGWSMMNFKLTLA